MKLTMEIDCTPDEAREFFGLPDVKPLQARMLQRIEERLVEAAATFSPEGILNTWFSLMPQVVGQSFDGVRKLLEREAPKT